MKRLKRSSVVTECSPWFSWFAWYPVKCRTGRGTYQVWLERVEYRYALIDGIYQHEYRIPQSVPTPEKKIRLTSSSNKQRASRRSL